jgi:hypothetical protein
MANEPLFVEQQGESEREIECEWFDVPHLQLRYICYFLLSGDWSSLNR